MKIIWLAIGLMMVSLFDVGGTMAAGPSPTPFLFDEPVNFRLILADYGSTDVRSDLWADLAVNGLDFMSGVALIWCQAPDCYIGLNQKSGLSCDDWCLQEHGDSVECRSIGGDLYGTNGLVQASFDDTLSCVWLQPARGCEWVVESHEPQFELECSGKLADWTHCRCEKPL